MSGNEDVGVSSTGEGLQGSRPASCDGGFSVARSNPDKDVTKDFQKMVITSSWVSDSLNMKFR